MARVKIIGRCCVGEYEESLEKKPLYIKSARRRCSRRIDSSTKQRSCIEPLSFTWSCKTIKGLPAPNVTAVDRVSWNADDVLRKEKERHKKRLRTITEVKWT